MFIQLLLVFFFGIKHSFDADHILAVSSLVDRKRGIRDALRLGTSWSIGHMITATIITIVLYAVGTTFLSRYLEKTELAVGVMLIGLGVLSLRTFRSGNIGRPVRRNHRHFFALGAGVLQGVASNDELLIILATALSIGTVMGVLLGAAIFSMGVVVGMSGFIFFFQRTQATENNQRLQKYLTHGVAYASVAYGLFIVFSFLLPYF